MRPLNRRTIFRGLVPFVVASLFTLSLIDCISTSRTTQLSTASPATPRITILYDAFGKNVSMKKDWGFSALIEMNGKRILFDAGDNPGIIAQNVRAAKVDLTKLDFVVISHRHSDHMGGLTYLLKVNPKVKISTHLVGEYNLPNVLAAVTIGKFFKVPEKQIRSAIENYIPSNSRSQLINKESNQIVLDAYNANPSSMRLAIENFAKLKATDKVLMLGGMMELGDESLQEHQAIVDLIQQYNWKNVVLVGGDFLKLKHPFEQFENSSQAGQWLKKQSFQNTHLLVKGSRSMQMEKVLEY